MTRLTRLRDPRAQAMIDSYWRHHGTLLNVMIGLACFFCFLCGLAFGVQYPQVINLALRWFSL